MKIDISKENLLARMQLPGSPIQLALIRILLGAQIFYSSSSELLNLLLVVDGTDKPTIFPAFLDNTIANIAVPYLQITVQILSVCLILGLFTRYILPLLFISFLCLFSFWYSNFDAPVPWLYIWFPLLVLTLSKCNHALALDNLFSRNKYERMREPLKSYRWPIELMAGWFAYIYLAAGLAKIFPMYKGLRWLEGGTSQKIIYDRYLDSVLHYVIGQPFFDYSSNFWFFGLLSLGSLLIELSCILIFFTMRLNYLIIFLVMSMHFFLYLTGVPAFMQTALILSIALLSPKLFEFRIFSFSK